MLQLVTTFLGGQEVVEGAGLTVGTRPISSCRGPWMSRAKRIGLNVSSEGKTGTGVSLPQATARMASLNSGLMCP